MRTLKDNATLNKASDTLYRFILTDLPKVLELQYWKLWPTNLSSITLTTKTSGEQYLEASVTFKYDRCEFT